MGERDTLYIGNTKLLKHGIQTEDSDFRIHVSFGTGKAYLFRTSDGRQALERGLGKPFRASQPGVDFVTGVGRKIPWESINGCIEIDIPQHWLDEVNCLRDDMPSEKGIKAVTIARWLLMKGKVPLPLATQYIEEKHIQIQGRDLIVTSTWAIEVKCDYWGGQNGLALQTHECNPLRRF